MLDQARSLAFVSRGGVRLAEAAYRFILDTAGVSTVIGGYSELAHLEEAAATSDLAPLSAEVAARLRLVWRANYGRSAEHAWATA
jgi:aryl-alcohol dehydrogenase-like predicted oxidoreductase